MDNFYLNKNKDTGYLEKVDILSGKVVEIYGASVSDLDISPEEMIEVSIGGNVVKIDPRIMTHGSEIRASRAGYSDLMASLILTKLMDGKTLTSITKLPGIPSMAVIMSWCGSNDMFRAAMDSAMRSQGHHYFDRVDSIAEELAEGGHGKSDVEGKKAALDGFKWLAEKSDPTRFGTRKVEVEHTGMTVVIQTGVPDRVKVDVDTSAEEVVVE